MDFAAPIGLGGIWLAYFLLQLERRPLHAAQRSPSGGGSGTWPITITVPKTNTTITACRISRRPGTCHEKTDIDISAIVRFGIGLCALAVVSFVLIWGFYHSSNRSMAGPLPPTGLEHHRRRPAAAAAPPADARRDLQEMLAAEDKLLHSYGWVDQQHGMVRIPIDRAIDLLAQRGLPSRPAAGPASAAANVTVPTESGLGPIMIQPGGPLACRNWKPAIRRPARQREGVTKVFSKFVVLAAFAGAALAQPGQPAPAQPSYSMQDSSLKPALPGALQGVGIDQKLDQQVPLNLSLPRRGRPRRVPLSTFFHRGKPVILVLVYYRCPMLCTQILTGVESSLRPFRSIPGRISKWSRSASIPRTRRKWPPPRSRCTCDATAAPTPPTAGTSSPATKPISRRSPTPWASTTSTIPRPTSSRTPAAS